MHKKGIRVFVCKNANPFLLTHIYGYVIFGLFFFHRNQASFGFFAVNGKISYAFLYAVRFLYIPAIKTDSATGPSEGPVVWKDSPGSCEKQFRFRQSFQYSLNEQRRPLPAAWWRNASEAHGHLFCG